MELTEIEVIPSKTKSNDIALKVMRVDAVLFFQVSKVKKVKQDKIEKSKLIPQKPSDVPEATNETSTEGTIPPPPPPPPPSGTKKKWNAGFFVKISS